MPEFILNKSGERDALDFGKSLTERNRISQNREFMEGYIEALFFTNGDCCDDNEWLLNELGTGRLTLESKRNILRDCDAFLGRLVDGRFVTQIIEAEPGDMAQAGRDFWFTRQHHGVGFWDRGDDVWSKPTRDALTRICQEFSESYVDVWRGWIHVR